MSPVIIMEGMDLPLIALILMNLGMGIVLCYLERVLRHKVRGAQVLPPVAAPPNPAFPQAALEPPLPAPSRLPPNPSENSSTEVPRTSADIESIMVEDAEHVNKHQVEAKPAKIEAGWQRRYAGRGGPQIIIVAIRCMYATFNPEHLKKVKSESGPGDTQIWPERSAEAVWHGDGDLNLAECLDTINNCIFCDKPSERPVVYSFDHGDTNRPLVRHQAALQVRSSEQLIAFLRKASPWLTRMAQSTDPDAATHYLQPWCDKRCAGDPLVLHTPRTTGL